MWTFFYLLSFVSWISKAINSIHHRSAKVQNITLILFHVKSNKILESKTSAEWIEPFLFTIIRTTTNKLNSFFIFAFGILWILNRWIFAQIVFWMLIGGMDEKNAIPNYFRGTDIALLVWHSSKYLASSQRSLLATSWIQNWIVQINNSCAKGEK